MTLQTRVPEKFPLVSMGAQTREQGPLLALAEIGIIITLFFINQDRKFLRHIILYMITFINRFSFVQFFPFKVQMLISGNKI